MPSEQYAAPARRRVAAGAAALLPPALVACALVGVVGQLHRLYSASQPGLSVVADPSQAASTPLALRVGYVLADPLTSGPALTPVIALAGLVGLHLLRSPAVRVNGSTRRAGALVAGVVTLVNLLLTVVVVVWVATTHGAVGDDVGAGGTGDFQASFQLDPWDTVLGHGSVGLVSCVAGAGALLLLTTRPAAPAPALAAPAPGPDAGSLPSTRPAAPPQPAGGMAPGAPADLGGSTGSADPEAAVVLVSSRAPDPQAFRRPVRSEGRPGQGDGRPGGGTAPGSAGDGYRRPSPGAASPG